MSYYKQEGYDTPLGVNSKDAVRAVQAFINESTGAGLKADGIWGPKTQQAYAAMNTQNAYGNTGGGLGGYPLSAGGQSGLGGYTGYNGSGSYANYGGSRGLGGGNTAQAGASSLRVKSPYTNNVKSKLAWDDSVDKDQKDYLYKLLDGSSMEQAETIGKQIKAYGAGSVYQQYAQQGSGITGLSGEYASGYPGGGQSGNAYAQGTAQNAWADAAQNAGQTAGQAAEQLKKNVNGRAAWGFTIPEDVSDVKEMQRQLGVQADGVWGEKTDEAYRAAQKIAKWDAQTPTEISKGARGLEAQRMVLKDENLTKEERLDMLYLLERVDDVQDMNQIWTHFWKKENEKAYDILAKYDDEIVDIEPWTASGSAELAAAGATSYDAAEVNGRAAKGYAIPEGVTDVRAMQQALGVKADGVWGEKTEAAWTHAMNGGGIVAGASHTREDADKGKEGAHAWQGTPEQKRNVNGLIQLLNRSNDLNKEDKAFLSGELSQLQGGGSGEHLETLYSLSMRYGVEEVWNSAAHMKTLSIAYQKEAAKAKSEYYSVSVIDKDSPDYHERQAMAAAAYKKYNAASEGAEWIASRQVELEEQASEDHPTATPEPTASLTSEAIVIPDINTVTQYQKKVAAEPIDITGTDEEMLQAMWDLPTAEIFARLIIGEGGSNEVPQMDRINACYSMINRMLADDDKHSKTAEVRNGRTIPHEKFRTNNRTLKGLMFGEDQYHVISPWTSSTGSSPNTAYSANNYYRSGGINTWQEASWMGAILEGMFQGRTTEEIHAAHGNKYRNGQNGGWQALANIYYTAFDDILKTACPSIKIIGDDKITNYERNFIGENGRFIFS